MPFTRIFNRKNKKLFFKYLAISTVSYLYTFVLLYLLIDEFLISTVASFSIVYGTAYLFLYGVQLKYLFSKKHDSAKLFRYLISILLFYISANIFYNLGLYFGLHYLISTAFTIIILMPLRLIVYTQFVYKDLPLP